MLSVQGRTRETRELCTMRRPARQHKSCAVCAEPTGYEFNVPPPGYEYDAWGWWALCPRCLHHYLEAGVHAAPPESQLDILLRRIQSWR